MAVPAGGCRKPASGSITRARPQEKGPDKIRHLAPWVVLIERCLYKAGGVSSIEPSTRIHGISVSNMYSLITFIMSQAR